MKLQVTQENLSKALNNVARIANTRGTLPILSNVLLKTVDGRLSIAATNLDIAINHYIGSKVGEEGSITVPARLMQDFVSSLPSGVIELELDDNKLHIQAEKYQSVINGMSADDFPVMPAIDTDKQFMVSGKQLKQSLQQVIVAASSDEARPVLTGVFCHTHEGNLYMVATDSYRLAEKRVMPLDQEVSLLIPASALQDLLRVLGDYEEDVLVLFDEQQVQFKVGDIELVTRLIEGSYPDYRKLIPGSFASIAVLTKSDFSNITKVSSLFARESAGSVTIHNNEQEGLVSIRSIASQLGENTASASATITGDGVITLNSRYILDALHAIAASDVQFAFNGKVEPCVISSPSDGTYTHVVMPLKS